MLEMKFFYDASVMFARLGVLAKKTIPFTRSTMRLIAQDALDIIKEKTPGKGTIRELWRILERKEGTIEEWVIRNAYEKQNILWYLEEGTNPHLIFPVRAPVLAWEDPSAPKGYRCAKRVVHPGTKPYGMIAAAYDAMDGIVEKYINALLDDLEIEMEKAAARNRGEMV